MISEWLRLLEGLGAGGENSGLSFPLRLWWSPLALLRSLMAQAYCPTHTLLGAQQQLLASNTQNRR